MALPQVLDRVSTTFGTTATSHPVAMPTITVAGRLLLIIIDLNQSTGTATTPSGWTLVQSGGTFAHTLVYAKPADGTEGGTTVDVVTSNSVEGAAYCIQVGTWGGSIANDIACAAPSTGTATNPDPPSTSWTWGSFDVLVIACDGHDKTSNATAAPTNYGNLNGIQAGGTFTAAVDIADRSIAAGASPEDPGAFTYGTSSNWTAFTIVIKGSGLPPYPWRVHRMQPRGAR